MVQTKSATSFKKAVMLQEIRLSLATQHSSSQLVKVEPNAASTAKSNAHVLLYVLMTRNEVDYKCYQEKKKQQTRQMNQRKLNDENKATLLARRSF